MSTHQFANIAPAPQGSNTMQSNQNQMSSPMGSQGGPNGSQVMSPGGQPMQQMPMGQFQIIQPQMGGPNTQYAVPQIATYNQQGQLVLQPANFAFQGMPQATGGQQYIFTTAPPQMQPQKPGQQMIATNQQQQGGKTMVPMTMGQAASYTITSTGMAANGAQQTFMIANPMGGAPIMATHQGNMGPAQMGGQIKQENNKQSQQQQQQQAQMQAQQQAQQQPILVPQGMYMTPQGQTAQAIFQNGQIILRAPMQDGQPQLMFSPPAHPLPQQPTMQAANTHQQLPPGMSTNMQPINMQPAAQMRPPVSVPSQPPPGKTQISRSLAPLLPTVSTSQSSMRQNYSGMPTMNSNQTTSSPKSKQKVSPRSGGGNVGRPPGPSKSAVNSMKLQQSPSSMSPPCLPNFPTQPNSPMMQGPPILQTSAPLVQPSRSSPHSQPPLLHPMMMLPTVPTTSGQDPTRYMGKPIDSQPPTLSASAPMPTLDSSKMMPSNKGTPLMSGSNSRKPDDKYNNGDSSADHNDSGHGSQTPKAVVKPNVLTHVIDGHIIQESSQPFPLDNSDSKGRGNSNHNQYNDEDMNDLSVSKNGNNTNDYNNKATANDSQQQIHQHQHHIASSAAASTTTTMTSSLTTTTSTPTSVVQGTNRNLVPKPVHQVHQPQPQQPQQQQQQQQLSSDSNKVKLNSKSLDNSGSEKKRGPGRPPGSTKQNLEQQKSHQNNSNGGDLKGKILDGPPTKKSKLDICDSLKISTVGGHSPTKPSSKSPTLNIDMTTNNPLKWSVTQVCDFVKSLPGCSDYVEDFQLQEIDGQALMLLKADHLMSAMAIKLGPALKICSAIDAMREELKQN